MKYLFLVCATLSLVSCSKVPDYIDGKTVWDENTCAFTVQHNAGDTLFLRFNKVKSGKDCLYIDYIGEEK